MATLECFGSFRLIVSHKLSSAVFKQDGQDRGFHWRGYTWAQQKTCLIYLREAALKFRLGEKKSLGVLYAMKTNSCAASDDWQSDTRRQRATERMTSAEIRGDRWLQTRGKHIIIQKNQANKSAFSHFQSDYLPNQYISTNTPLMLEVWWLISIKWILNGD